MKFQNAWVFQKILFLFFFFLADSHYIYIDYAELFNTMNYGWIIV